jgi:prepilin-type N-terminal cleavage/methylation domain-containing protein
MQQKGFTLIELIVAVAIFTIVMMVSMGAVFSIVNANRKSQSMNVVINNLNFAFESMIRDLRTGSDYEVNGGVLTFIDRDSRRVSYQRIPGENGTGVILKDYIETNEFAEGEITDPEVRIDDLSFDLVGEGPDGSQLLLRIHLQGTTGNPANNTASSFNIQTLVSPRELDNEDL